MSLKLFMLRVVRPVALVTAVTGSAYGYKEWEKAKSALKLSTNDSEMIALFDKVDKNHSGYIEKQDLRDALKSAGYGVNLIALDAMMKVADENHDGRISKDEWLHICHSINNDGSLSHPFHLPTSKAGSPDTPKSTHTGFPPMNKK